MKYLPFKILVTFISIFLLSACGDDEPAVEDIPSSYFSWSIDGESFSAKNTGQYAYSSGPNFVILGESSVGGIVIVSLDNANGHPGATGKTFQMDEQTPDELIYEDSRGDRWSSMNPGGSATVNLSLYQTYGDATFVKAFVEGTLSGTLTSTTDSTIYVIENGEFGVKEN